MGDNPQPVLRSMSEGRTVAVVGDVYRFLAVGEETDGQYATWEALVPPGGGPPPHIHSREHESFYVIDGEVAFYLGEQRTVLGPGGFVEMPPGSLHRFANESGRPARMIISVCPAGLEQMFFEVGQPVTPGANPSPPTQDEIQRLLAVAPKYGLEIRLPHG